MGRYDKITDAYYQGLMASVGYRRKDIDKPLIGIVNSWNDVNPGHKPFKELAQYVKEGIWAAGGTPAEFGVPAPCDGMSQMLGMQYVLPQRDMIAASAEAMARAHHFDGMVFLCSCDKIVPGMLMCAAALDIPALVLTAGSMIPYQIPGRDHPMATSDLKESIGEVKAGRSPRSSSGITKTMCAIPAGPVLCTGLPIPWGSLRKYWGSALQILPLCSIVPLIK